MVPIHDIDLYMWTRIVFDIICERMPHLFQGYDPRILQLLHLIEMRKMEKSNVFPSRSDSHNTFSASPSTAAIDKRIPCDRDRVGWNQ